MIDVLIAGGGPAGLATAIRCAREGLSVTVAEPRATPVDKACGEGLMPAAVQRLAAIGVHPAGHPISGIRYLDPRHSVDAPFKDGTGLGVRRTTLHAALAMRAASLGIEVIPARVAGSAQDAKGITAQLTSNGPWVPATVSARYLVAADGLHSPLRKAAGLDPVPARYRRFGLRRHYRLAPWTRLVEVHWARDCEAYVTPVAEDEIGIAVLGGPGGNLDTRLAAFPELLRRVQSAGAVRNSEDRGAGPLRQDVRRRVAGRVLLVGDAAGYTDALTGEGIGAALAQAEALAQCLAAGRPHDYERAWRRVTRKERLLTSGLLWARRQQLLAPRIVASAAALPGVYTAIVNQVAWALGCSLGARPPAWTGLRLRACLTLNVKSPFPARRGTPRGGWIALPPGRFRRGHRSRR
jgi:flavin-dependent dehydrogenase